MAAWLSQVSLNAEPYLTELFKHVSSATMKTVHDLTPHSAATKRSFKVQAAVAELASARLINT